MPLTQKSLDFLEENHNRNSREWFADHKQDYKEHVETPMLELAQAVAPLLVDIDPLLIAEPKRTLSKIWRDTRFSKDKTVFKRASWFVFQRSKGMVHPVWFFEFTPDFHRYGCGYYSAPTAVMAHMRELILAGDKRYKAAQKALDTAPAFTLEGDLYKRPKYPDAPKKQQHWLERKSITAMHTSQDTTQLLSENLAQHLKDSFIKLAPVYDFLIYAHESHYAMQESLRLSRRSLYDDGFSSF